MKTWSTAALFLFALGISEFQHVSTAQLANVPVRKQICLDGTWQILPDQFDYYAGSKAGPISRAYVPVDKWERVEFAFSSANTLQVPGDWNTQAEKYLFYEGTIWYKKDFEFRQKRGARFLLYFGAVNYKADVYLNGALLGVHEGGFTPFSFECTSGLREGRNTLVVKVNNTRQADRIPAMEYDWWNFGGITRSVSIIELPMTFIRDYSIQLRKGDVKTIEGWILLDGKDLPASVEVVCRELGLSKSIPTNGARHIPFTVKASPRLWSPESPKLYGFSVIAGDDSVQDIVGFRTVAASGKKILLNGKPVFLRGVSIHEEALFTSGRIANPVQIKPLLQFAKELNCNFIRLAHYPHSEETLRLADEMGLMVWSEVPVWQNIDFLEPKTAQNARQQLEDMIVRDKNRASIILWSIANETYPESKGRLEFLKSMVSTARRLDSTRLITSALHKQIVNDSTLRFDDPLGEYLDVLAVNEYIGWYQGSPADCRRFVWQTVFDKPHLVSEFGAEALYGYHADSLTIWSEEFQAALYKYQFEMIDRIPFVSGVSPWILKDFRSPRRLHPEYQNYFNRKGVVSNAGERKLSFWIMQDYYRRKALSIHTDR